MKATGPRKFFAAIGEMLDAAAEAAAVREAELRAENVEKQKVIDMVNDWNANHPRNQIVLPREAPTVTKCSPFRLLEDCEDKDCFRHYEEKRRLAAKRQQEKPQTSSL